MDKTMRIMSLAILSLLVATELLGQTPDTKHNFPIGMFSVIGNRRDSANVRIDPQPGSSDFRDELISILRGNTGGYEGANILHHYGYPLMDVFGNIDLWRTLLADIDSVSEVDPIVRTTYWLN